MTERLTAVVVANGSIELEWITVVGKVAKDSLKLERAIYRNFQSNPAPALLRLGFSSDEISLSESLEFWRKFSRLFVQKLTKIPDLEKIRQQVKVPFEEREVREFLVQAPFMVGSEYLDLVLLEFLWNRINGHLQKEIAQYDGTVANLLKSHSPNLQILGRVYFHLVENKNQPEYPFAFLATYSSSLAASGESRHLPLKCALQEYENDESMLLDLLISVEQAAQQSDLLAELLDSGEIFHPLAWTIREAHTFLKEVPIYEQNGILCRIPDWWKGQQSSFKISISIGDSSPSHLGMEAILSFDAALVLGDRKISEQEARKILEESQGLAYIKGRWVEVNAAKLERVLDAFAKAKKAIEHDSMTLKEAMQLQLGAKKLLEEDDEDLVDFSHGKWLQSVVNKLQNPQLVKHSDCGRNFRAQLRPYQQRGLNWLFFMHSLQFGACLADDMGLGKTVQVLAFLNRMRSKKLAASLLVVPASLLANWKSEIHRFTPSLKYYIAHPGFNSRQQDNLRANIDEYDLIITTYALVFRREWIEKHRWHYLILDEAQAIKNPRTKQSRAVKKLHSFNRLALTGTPIENRLADLWSLYDFINPGLLGNSGEFSEFTKGLKDNPRGYSCLKNVITPYMLRRLKTDKSIISDLPEKIEMKIYAELSKKQLVLYRALVEHIEKSLRELEGSKRRGLILGSLTKFKQICNHPGQYLGNGDFSEKDSGKFTRLREICETVYEKRERVLVFTQFKEIISGLENFLSEVFGKKGLILHGGTPVGQRKKLVERFQSSEYVPFFILSVKAGGLGLNLTQANHVIHFDRWWNPAVENQATDRAFRIGQKKNVVVHKFVTRGTLEEKIDDMLLEKSSLSQNVIQSGENWIMNMDNGELINLFKLSL